MRCGCCGIADQVLVGRVIEDAELIGGRFLVLFFKKEQKALLFAKSSKNYHSVIVDDVVY
jgi:hypothetical protein